MQNLKSLQILLCLLAVSLVCFSSNTVTNYTNDTLTISQIDSIIKSTKSKSGGTKIKGANFTENYHYNKKDNTVYLVAIFESKDINNKTINCSTLYYFIKEKLSKITYWEGNVKKQNVYYFQNGQLVYKDEIKNLHTQDVEMLLLHAENYKSKWQHF